MIYISPTVVAAQLGNKLVGSSKGIVLEALASAPYFSLADAGPGDNANDEIKIEDNTHDITAEFSSGPLLIYNSTVNIAFLNANYAPGLSIYGTQRSGGSHEMLGVINAGGHLLDSTRAAGPRVLVPWGGTGADPLLLNANGRLLMRRTVDWAAGVQELVGVQVTLRCASESGPALTARAEVVGRPRP